MNLEQVISTIDDHGLVLRLVGDKVRVVTMEDSTPLPDQTFSWLKSNKDQVRDHLREELRIIRFKGESYRYKTWSGQMMGDLIAVDTETTVLTAPDQVPGLVITAAFDGRDLFFIGPDQIEPWLEQHQDKTFIFHNARFDVRVLESVTVKSDYLLTAIDHDRVWDTYLFEKGLNLARHGDPDFPRSGLDHCCQRYFDTPIPKDLKDEDGDPIRLSFGKHSGKSPDDIPAEYLKYAGLDPVSTWFLLEEQKKSLPAIREKCRQAYGYTSDEHLDAAWKTFGPLSLFIQIKADVAFGYMTDEGLGRDLDRCQRLHKSLVDKKDAAEKAMVESGIGPGEGCQSRREEYLSKIEKRLLENKTLKKKLNRTPTGRISTSKKTKDLILSMEKDPVLLAWQEYNRCTKWIGTYVSGLLDETRNKISIIWKTGAKSGRTKTGSKKEGTVLPAQCLPKDILEAEAEVTVRQCLTPLDPSHVVIGADYSTLEVVTFAAELMRLGFGEDLAEVIRQGRDVHRALAAVTYGLSEDEVTSQQRKTVKPMTFGIPGGMKGPGLQEYAKTFGQDLSLKDVERIQEGYEKLNPAISRHVEEQDLGLRIAKMIGAKSKTTGWTFLRTISGKKWGKPAKDPSQYWQAAYKLTESSSLPEKQKTVILDLIKNKKAGDTLWNFFREESSMTSQLSNTGRLRARASFRSSRNGLFQSPASDGGLLACWNLFRKGFRLIGFIHDEILAVTPADGSEWSKVEELSKVMIDTMEDLIGLPVKTEGFVRKSLSGRDDIPKPELQTEILPPPDYFCSKPKQEEVQDLDPDDIIVEWEEPKKRSKTYSRRSRKAAADSEDLGLGELPF